MKKLLGIIATVCVALAVVLALPMGCKKNDDPPVTPPEYAEYQISLVSRGGVPVRDALVKLVGDGIESDVAVTDNNGVAKVQAKEGLVYDVQISNLPAGFKLINGLEYKTSADSTEVKCVLKTEVIKDEEIPATKKYAVGDVMYDFTFTDVDGNEYVLSEVLEEKSAVVLNFWATWCGWCIKEFPAMDEAYGEYLDQVEIFAINGDYESKATINSFLSDKTYAFPFGEDDAGIYPRVGSGSLPLTVIVDRYGVVCAIETGAITDANQWIAEFERLCSDDYSADIELGGNGDDEYDEGYVQIKPDVTAPASSDIEKAINSSSYTFSYYFDEDEYNWPWQVSDDGKSVYATNVARTDNLLSFSWAIMYSKFTAKAGDVLTFDYDISTSGYGGYASNSNYLAVQIDGTLLKRLAGEKQGTCYAYEVPADGEYTLSLTYYKNFGDIVGDDIVSVSNMRLLKESEVNEDLLVKMFGASVKNENYTDGTNGETKYKNYVEPVMGDDGYFHVGTKNGPLLLVDVLFTTNWSSVNSVYQYAVEGYCIFDGTDYNDMVTELARLASHSDTETVPVTLTTKALLEAFTENFGSGYEGEWLELCEYYKPYGNAKHVSDPIDGLNTDASRPLKVGVNHIDVNKAPLPRGMYYEFVAEETGLYIFESIVAQEDLELCDPIAWLADENGEIYKESDFFSDSSVPGGINANFRFIEFLEKGEKVYVLCTLYWHPETGEYDMKVTYDTTTTKFLLDAAIGPHQGSLDSNELTVYGAIDIALDDNGYWRHVKENGELGSYIYVDFTHTTTLFGGWTLANAIESAENANIPNFNLTEYGGQDYTEAMKTYLAAARANTGELAGMVKADKTLTDMLTAYISTDADGLYGDVSCSESWLMASFYYE
ncbi:MAG: redoxin domain-containing protein [Clostridia bacterium]|nr:redoxin domain-containing protein [Clostridia bacterium]